MRRKILVADDSISIQKLVAMAFYNEDMDVEGISEGTEAYTYVTANQPDLVMADVYLPGINGFELSKQIKTNPGLSHIKVLLLTSDFEELDEIMYADSEADDHISKPFKTEEIINKVRSLMAGDASPQAAEAPVQDEEVEVISVAEEFENRNAMHETMAAAAGGGGEAYIVETITIPKDKASAKIIELTPGDLTDAVVREVEEDEEDDYEDEAPQPMIIAANALLEDDFEELDELFHQLVQRNAAESNGDGEMMESSPEAVDNDQPNLIREALAYFGETQEARTPDAPAPEESGPTPLSVVSPRQAPEQEPPTLDEQIHDAIEKTMNASMKSEMAGLSDTIVQSVGQIVKEVAPDVIRKVVQEEIEQIKKSDQD